MDTKVCQVINHKRAAFSGLGKAWRTLLGDIWPCLQIILVFAWRSTLLAPSGLKPRLLLTSCIAQAKPRPSSNNCPARSVRNTSAEESRASARSCPVMKLYLFCCMPCGFVCFSVICELQMDGFIALFICLYVCNYLSIPYFISQSIMSSSYKPHSMKYLKIYLHKTEILKIQRGKY